MIAMADDDASHPTTGSEKTMTRPLVTLILIAIFALGCDKKPAETKKDDTPKQTTKNDSKKPEPKKPDENPQKKPETKPEPKKPYTGPDADLKEKLEKAYFELRCLAEKSKPADIAAKQEEIYKKYGFKSTMDYTNGINKLKDDTEYWKQLLARAKTHCKN